MTLTHSIVYLVDVDNTLIDNDGIQQDLKDHLEQVYGLASRVRYWKILEDLFEEVGYRDYLGALQRYRAEHPRQVELLSMSSFLIDYPFAERLFPAALALLKRLRSSWSDRHPVGRGCRLPAAQGGALGSMGRRGRTRADLCPQGAGPGRRRAPISRRPLRARGRQAAHPGCGEASLGRPRHDCLPASGLLRARPEGARNLSSGRRYDREHRRPPRL